MIRIMECCLCGKVKRANLVLLGRNICAVCEKSLIQTEVEDSLYDLYKNSIKDILAATAKKL